MPLYDYTCDSCGRREELIVGLKALDLPISCANVHCGGTMQRQPSAPGFALKGGGWTPKFHNKQQPRRGD